MPKLRTQTDRQFNTRILTAMSIHQNLPAEVIPAVHKACDQLCDLGEAMQLSPAQIIVCLALVIGALALVETDGNAGADQEIDEFVSNAHAAIHYGVAKARLASGWHPSGVN
jgi:hypothetical protein